MSESDRRGFPPQIQKAFAATQLSTQHPQSIIDQRPSIQRPASDTSMAGIDQPPIATHSASTVDHRSIDQRPIHPWWALDEHPSPRTQHPQSTIDQRTSIHRPASDTTMVGS